MKSPLLDAMKRLLSLGRPWWRLLGASFIGMALVAITTGAYAYLLGPGLRFLLNGGSTGELPGVPGLTLEQLPWLLLIVGAFKGVGYVSQFYFAGLFGQRVVLSLRRNIFQKLQRLPPSTRSDQRSGDLLSRFTADVAAVEQAATYTVSSWLRDSVQIIVLAAVAAIASWKLALISLVIVPLAVFPASRLTAALTRRTREGQAALGGIAAQVQEGLGALRTIQAFDAETAELQRFEKQTSSLERALTRAAWARAGVPAIMEIFAASAIAASIAWAISSRSVSPDALVSFVAALGLIYEPAKNLGRVSQFAISAGVALERIDQLLALHEPEQGTRELAKLEREISLLDVRFSWRPGTEVLRGVSFTIPAGKITALVSGSGGGKSTIVSLLMGFEHASAGTITLDGVDIRDATHASLRSQFALVTQEPLLFSASVRENVRVARPEASDAQISAALQAAHALEFVTALPNGVDTPLGERGVTLSGGQKQRLCLARAVLSGAPVLVLDEATSNLDPASELEVQRALDELLVGRTAIVIAHRLQSVQRAHQLVVLENGAVAETGTHETLLARGGVWSRLWSLANG